MMLPFFLILMIIILVIPWPLSKTLKKLWPILGVLLAVALAALMAPKDIGSEGNELAIEALNETNKASDGKEVWLLGMTVDGKNVLPEEYFGSGWITEKGALIWRPYDQKREMSNSISAHFKPGTQVVLKFQTNKWRGMARVSYGSQKEKIDLYSDTDRSDQVRAYTITIPEMQKQEKYSFTAKDVLFFVLAALILLNILYIAFFYLLRRKLPFDNRTYLSREVWLDLLKVISSIMIILIHSSGYVYTKVFSQDASLWNKMLWVNAIPRFAVPCYLMITGVLTLGKEYNYGRVLYQKVLRILVPLLAWSTVYVITRKLLWHGNENIVEELLKIPFKRQDGSLWYAYQLIWLYLGMPFWQTLYRHLPIKLRYCFVAFSLGIPGVLTMLGELSLLDVPEYLPFASSDPLICYVGVLFLGKMLYDLHCESKKNFALGKGIILACCGLGIMVAASIYVSQGKNEAVSTFFSEVRLPAILYGSGIFLIFASMKDLLQKLPGVLMRTIYSFSKVSFGVYLSHCLILLMFPSMMVAGIYVNRDSGSILQLMICVFVYYGITSICCFLLSNLPGLRKLVL
jgi:surface polysaccharide O-acyltransferase-like enzyme